MNPSRKAKQNSERGKQIRITCLFQSTHTFRRFWYAPSRSHKLFPTPPDPATEKQGQKEPLLLITTRHLSSAQRKEGLGARARRKAISQKVINLPHIWGCQNWKTRSEDVTVTTVQKKPKKKNQEQWDSDVRLGLLITVALIRDAQVMTTVVTLD